MGCGGIRSKLGIQNEDLIKEMEGGNIKEIKGLIIKDNIQVHKILSQHNNIFKEEILDHADESGLIKPWISNIVPPEIEVVEKKTAPEFDLKLEHVFGYRSYDVRQNLFFTDINNICYMTGACGIVQNINNFSQKIFGGNLEPDCNCHNDDIVSIAFHKGDVSMIATGQRGIKPSIMIWSSLDPTILYYKFYQFKDTKEVSSLQFDRKGEYIASVGKDSNHSFFVFKFDTLSVYWTDTTSKNPILDLQFNPLGEEICLVGDKVVYFLYISRKMKREGLVKNMKYADQVFTAATYTIQGHCLTSTASGKILIWENCIVIKEIQICDSMIPNLTYSDLNDKIYISDSNKFVYIFQLKKNPFIKFTLVENFSTISIVKALDVGPDESIIMGLKNGTIVLKNSKGMKDLVYSHSEGRVRGLEYVPDRYLLTVGDDNLIILWNVNTKLGEEKAIINEKPIATAFHDKKNLTHYAANQCSGCIAFNKKTEHVVIGLDSGHISVRKGIRNLSEKVQEDIIISNHQIIELKYCPSGRLLAISTIDNQFWILNGENHTLIHKLIVNADYITQFDWDSSSKFIQAVSNDNNYMFYNVKSSMLITGNYFF